MGPFHNKINGIHPIYATVRPQDIKDSTSQLPRIEVGFSNLWVASIAGFSGRALFDRSWRGFLTPHLPRPKVPSEPLYQNNETFDRHQRRGRETRA
jgi:hypothetical protein